ncbi:uncharacterized protein LOC132197653 [Neocloeon triangulifer]|uniref:uncharacterized protein LOC132197653 n=1 Tax=Neocloeon triangulifer TaxID=2078957 RepID=UPI00286F6403|nr:uncharacterized protein LOC132197653 [Neocloeon triangulifer]
MTQWPVKALFILCAITATLAYHRSESIWNDEQSDSMWDLVDDNDISWIWKTRQTTKNVNHEDFEKTESNENKASILWRKIAAFFKSIFIIGSEKQLEDNSFKSKFNKSSHARVKRAQNRQLMVKCCGSQTCSDGSTANYERRQVAKDQKEKESAFVNEMQYSGKRKRKKRPKVNLDQLRAYGVFTAEGIHISCAGCPSGWPDMLTVYPDYEIGIPVTCSNCPNNWPGALNLLGVGGDPTWNNQQPSEGNNGFGQGGGTNNFFSFDTGSNFGGGGGAVAFPPSGSGKNGGKTDNQNYGGQDDYYSDETDSAPLARSTRPKRRGSTTAAATGNGDDGETSEPNEDAGADDGGGNGEEEAASSSPTESTSSSEVTSTKAEGAARKSAGTSAASTNRAVTESTPAADDTEDGGSDATGSNDEEETKDAATTEAAKAGKTAKATKDAAASETSKTAETTKAKVATTAAPAAGDDFNLDSR